MRRRNKLLLLLVFLFIIIFTNISMIVICRNYIHNTMENIVSSLLLQYPNDEELIINALLEEPQKLHVLEKYGIEQDTFNEITSFATLLKKMVIIMVVFDICILVLWRIFYVSQNLKIKKEMKRINCYLNEILKGSYDLNIASYNEDELSVLKNDIYKVTMKLKELSLYEKGEQVYLVTTLEDISHQLKTPLTALMLTNDILKNNDLTQEEREKFLNKQTKELEKMQWLITTLLNMSKLSSGAVTLKREKIKAHLLIQEALESFVISLELKQVNVILNHLDFLLVCDILWTKEAISNILKNAYEHVNKDGEISISGENNPLYQAITIRDNGCGISKEDIQNIFKRFYSTNKNSQSVGIGLNLAKLIIEKQNGKVEVESELGKYTSFKVIFPK